MAESSTAGSPAGATLDERFSTRHTPVTGTGADAVGAVVTNGGCLSGVLFKIHVVSVIGLLPGGWRGGNNIVGVFLAGGCGDGRVCH